MQYIVELPATITFQQQQEIINETKERGRISRAYDSVPVWKSLTLTQVAINDISHPTLNQYAIRLDERAQFEWNDDFKSSHTVKEILEQVSPLYDKITRVVCLLQRPGFSLNRHRDLVPGNTYDKMINPLNVGVGDKELEYAGYARFFADIKMQPEQSNIHARQHFMNLKIPLSEKEDDPGLPYVIYDEHKEYIKTNNHLYLLNEYECEHGADVVDFWRGVVFVDGFFNKSTIEEYII